jgi:hypothetical protein
MPLARIRQRLIALEKIGTWARIGKLPPLTSAEIADIAERCRRREWITKVEMARVARQSPIVDGEIIMTGYRGKLIIKRYVGVNLADV